MELMVRSCPSYSVLLIHLCPYTVISYYARESNFHVDARTADI